MSSSLPPLQIPIRLFAVFWFSLVSGIPVEPIHAQEPSGLASVAAIEEAFVKAIEQAEPSVVAIRRERARGNLARVRPGGFNRFPPVEIPEPVADEPDNLGADWGAGIVVGTDGLIVTNLHVVAGGPVEGRAGETEFLLRVHLSDRRTFLAAIRAADPRSDLAVLKIAANDLKPIKLGDGSRLKKGQLVVALGNPYALAGDGSASASWGIVANLSRKAALEGQRRGEETLHHFGTLIQLDARLNLGTSGGALVNLRGELVGITTSLAALAGYEKSVGFAVPVDDWSNRVIDTLKRGLEVEYGFLGITPADYESAQRQGVTGNIGQSGAAWVQAAHQYSPASLGKIKGNDLILAVNDRPILSVHDLLREIGKLPPGDTARIRIFRPDERRELTLPVVLGKWPVPDHEQIIATQRRYPAWRGLVVDYSSARLRFADPTNLRAPSVLITEVDPDSPAAKAELQPGSFILRVNEKPVRTPREFQDVIKSLTGPATLDMIVGDATVKRQLTP